MYRIKEALIIMWYVLTHKYYVFYSAKRAEIGNNGGTEYHSVPVEKFPVFLEAVSDHSKKMADNFKNLAQN